MRLSPDVIDESSTAFDLAWTPEQTHEAITEQIVCAGGDAKSSVLLAIELTTIDLERRWKAWSRGLRIGADLAPCEILSELNALPRASTYRRCLEATRMAPAEAFEQELLPQLRQVEFESRCRYGDLPHPRSWSTWTPTLPRRGFAMQQVTLQRHNEEIRRGLELWGECRFGRRSQNDPAPFGVTESLPPKIIIAEADDARFSRQQIHLRVVSKHFAIVENPSRNSSFQIGEQVTAGPGSIRVEPFPFRIQLDSLQIGFSRSIPASPKLDNPIDTPS